MTDLRKAANMALHALEFSLPAIEDFGSKEQLTDCHKAIMALYKSLAQPEQEEPLPLVDIGVDVTPEGTHVVACYNRPDAVQEMFYSQFHPLTKPEQEPVCDKDPFYCWSIRCQVGKVCKHTAPPRKEWVGLTNVEVQEIAKQLVDDAAYCSTHFAIAIEAELRRKNNAV